MVISCIIICFFFSLPNPIHVSASPPTHLCRPDQKDALLEFKNEFYIQRHDDDALMKGSPKTDSWKDNVDCCSWDGITCDSTSGDVIGLDLNHSLLNGPLRLNTSLYRLKHLQSLNLGSNNFSSSLPDTIDKLKSLNVLRLYSCNLFGGIPASLGNLSAITVLDLSGNDFTGEVPSSIGNLNHLFELELMENKLEGNFPLVLLNLTELAYVNLRSNQFTDQLPSNISKLFNLVEFGVTDNSFSGTVPSSLFTMPSLTRLCLERNQLSGPLEIGNVSSSSKLKGLFLGGNKLYGQIPGSISKLVNIKFIDLSFWNTDGSMVDFSIFSNLRSLEYLDISYLNTRNTVELKIFSNLRSLSYMDLSGSNVNISSTISLPRPLDTLILSTCSIRQFPLFLMSLSYLNYLDLSYNGIQGEVPKWFWTLPMLREVNISHNSFHAFEGSLEILRDTRITTLDISSNMFHGSLPALPVSTKHLLSSTNYFSGEIPQWICNLTNLWTLDLSNNNFSGSIPWCFKNLKSNLSVLHLQNNSLSGVIPQESINAYKLKSLNLGHNRFLGALPKSLSNCTRLRLLNVENNKINDTFPFWLESLPELLILVLRSNEFYGPIYSPRASSGFPLLRMIDISQNHFSGTLPANYFVSWSAMSVTKTFKYGTPIPYAGHGSGYFHESVVLTNKGIQMELVGSSFAIYTSINFFGNRFDGEIPESIGLLKEVIVLNLSNNAFTGHIPPSLRNLAKLESLDLSRNKLSGSIPPELGRLSSLSAINLSHNNLVGLIPQGTQFTTQPCSAFLDNIGLYGPPLGQSCGEGHTITPQQHKAAEPEEAEEEEEIISWIAAGIGVVPGVVFGLTMGYIVSSYKNQWFMKIRRRSTIH